MTPVREVTVICEQCGHHQQVAVSSAKEPPIGTPIEEEEDDQRLRGVPPRPPIGIPLDDDE